MKHRPPLPWIVFIGSLLVLGPLFLLWRLTPSGPSYPIERFMPDRPSAALCLRQPHEAWTRHWTARAGPAPEAALQALFEAMDKWPRWIKKYGEIKAHLRLKLYQEAFFRTTGEEAWMVFGEWGGGQSGAGQAGLVAFIRGNSPVRSRVGPLMDLMLEDYKIQRSKCEGETVYEYVDKRLGRSLTFCQIGGWICVSLRRRDAGPLPAIIRQVKSGDGTSTRSAVLALMPAMTSATQALTFGVRPDLFWQQLDEFTAQRGRKFSKTSKQAIQTWRRQLEGIERLTLAQAGDSILDLQMNVEGPRAAQLNRTVAQPSATLVEQTPPQPLPEGVGAELGQLEMALPAARLGLDMAGAAWKNPLENAQWLDLVEPGLHDQLDALLVRGNPDVQGRIGLAAYATPALPLPKVLYWVGEAQARPTYPARDNAWERFIEQVRASQPDPPLAFLSLNFHGVSGELDKVPTLLMKKKLRKKIERWKATMRGLALATGGAAVRLDGTGQRWTLTCRTP